MEAPFQLATDLFSPSLSPLCHSLQLRSSFRPVSDCLAGGKRGCAQTDLTCLPGDFLTLVAENLNGVSIAAFQVLLASIPVWIRESSGNISTFV